METSWRGKSDTSTGQRIQERLMEDGNVGVFVDDEFVLGTFEEVVKREKRFAFWCRYTGEN